MRRSMVRVLVLLVILGVPGSAIGSVVPNACIAGVGLWDSRERVARRMGSYRAGLIVNVERASS